jgi:hypothetical protein
MNKHCTHITCQQLRTMGKRVNRAHNEKKTGSSDSIATAQRKDELRRAGVKSEIKNSIIDTPPAKKTESKAAKKQPEAEGSSSRSDQDIKESKLAFDPKAIAEKHGWTYTEQAKGLPGGKAWIITHMTPDPFIGMKSSNLRLPATEEMYNGIKDHPVLERCSLAAQAEAIAIAALLRGASTPEEMKFVLTAATVAKQESIQRCIDELGPDTVKNIFVFASPLIDPTGQTVSTFSVDI